MAALGTSRRHRPGGALLTCLVKEGSGEVKPSGIHVVKGKLDRDQRIKMEGSAEFALAIDSGKSTETGFILPDQGKSQLPEKLCLSGFHQGEISCKMY